MKIVFAGGGTAGHIEPALAVARQWSAEHPRDELLFLGTTSGLETHLVPQAGYQLCLIPRVRIPRSISPQIFRVPITLVQSIRASKKRSVAHQFLSVLVAMFLRRPISLQSYLAFLSSSMKQTPRRVSQIRLAHSSPHIWQLRNQ